MKNKLGVDCMVRFSDGTFVPQNFGASDLAPKIDEHKIEPNHALLRTSLPRAAQP